MRNYEFLRKFNTERLWNKRMQNEKELNKKRIDDYYERLAKAQCSDDYAARVRGL